MIRTALLRQLLIPVVSVVAALAICAQTYAGPVAAVLKQLAKHADEAARTADDVETTTRRILGELAEHLDESASTARVSPIRKTDLERVLRDAGFTDEFIDDFRTVASTLDEKQLGLAVEALLNAKRIADAGVPFKEAVETIRKAGPNVIWAVKQVDDDVVPQVVEGCRRFGKHFVEFVQKGDTKAVKALMDDESLVRAMEDVLANPRHKYYSDVLDLLKNPAKYFDELGNAKRALKELRAKLVGGSLRSRLKILLKWAGAIWATAILFGRKVAQLLPEAIQGIATIIMAVFSLLVAALATLALFLPLLWRIFSVFLRFCWRFVALLLGVVGWQGNLSRRHGFPKVNPSRQLLPGSSSIPVDELRLGVIGLNRAGKTTFMVMLTKYLSRLVPGSTIEPATDNPDGEIFKGMEEEVRYCRPTKEDKKIRFKLTWPFRWRALDEPDNRDDTDRAGKLVVDLDMRDYPGEWCLSAEGREELSKRLRDLDGLMVVIDPTDLETPQLEERLKNQIEAIENMFKEDRIGLGTRYNRSVAVVITKRDALKPEMIDRLVKESSKQLSEEEVSKLKDLVGKRTLTRRESRELGRRLFELLFPGEAESLKTKLEPQTRQTRGKAGVLPAFLRASYWNPWQPSAKPPIEFFAITQLGWDLGKQVEEFRRQNRASGNGDGRITLELDKVKPDELEVHYPFEWLFDSIPYGWRNELIVARTATKGRVWPFWYGTKFGRLEKSWRKRFEGSPAVQEVLPVIRRRQRGTWAMLVLVALLFVGVVCRYAYLDECDKALTFFDRVAANISDSDSLAAVKKDLDEFERGSYFSPFKRERAWLAVFLDKWPTVLEEQKEIERPLPSIEAADFDERLTEYLTRVDRCGRLLGELPSVPSAGVAPIQYFGERVERFKERLAGKIRETILQAVRQCQSQSKYDLADKLLERGIHTLRGSMLQSVAYELEEERHINADEQTDHLYKELEDCLAQLLAQNQYSEAISEIDNFEFGIPKNASEQKKRDVREKAERKRDEICHRYWDFVRNVIEQSIESVEPEPIMQQLEAIKQIPNLPEDIRDEIAQVEQSYVDRLLTVVIDRAYEHFANGKCSEAIALFERSRRWLNTKGVSAEVLIKWHNGYITTLASCGKWLEVLGAIDAAKRQVASLWSGPDEDREKLIKSWDGIRDNAWKRAYDQCSAEINSMQSVEQAQKINEKLLVLKQHAKPNDEAEQVEELQKRWARKSLELKLAELDSSDEPPETTLKVLSGLLVEVMKANEQELACQWYALYKRELDRWVSTATTGDEHRNRLKEAATKLEGLAQELRSLCAEKYDVKQDIDKYWQQYVEKTKEIFEDQLKGPFPERGWQELYLLTQDESLPDNVRQQLETFGNEKLIEQLNTLENKVRSLCRSGKWEDARKEIDLLEERIGIWKVRCSDRLKDLRCEIELTRLEQRLNEIDSAIRRVQPDYQKIFGDISSVLGEIEEIEPPKDSGLQTKAQELEDRCHDLKKEVLTKWEEYDFDRLELAYKRRDFDRLREEVDKYLDAEYIEIATPEHVQGVKRLKSWFDHLDRLAEYEITAVYYYGIPYSKNVYDVFNPRFDPVFRIRIGPQDKPQTEIKTKMESVYGDGKIEEFTTERRFRWKPGVPVFIRILDDDNPKKLIGEVDLGTDLYGLIRAVCTPVKVDCSKTKFPDYDWSNFKIQLEIGNLPSLPEFP